MFNDSCFSYGSTDLLIPSSALFVIEFMVRYVALIVLSLAMNHQTYSLILELVLLMRKDQSLCCEASRYGDWYNNLIENMCDYESDHLDMCLMLRFLKKEISGQ